MCHTEELKDTVVQQTDAATVVMVEARTLSCRCSLKPHWSSRLHSSLLLGPACVRSCHKPPWTVVSVFVRKRPALFVYMSRTTFHEWLRIKDGRRGGCSEEVVAKGKGHARKSGRRQSGTSNGANQSGCSAPASSGSTGLEQACHPRAPAGNDSDEQRAPGAAPDNLPGTFFCHSKKI